MIIYKRICIRDFEVTAENGDHFKVERGKKYITSNEQENGDVVVFSKYWVPVPVSFFAGEEKYT